MPGFAPNTPAHLGVKRRLSLLRLAYRGSMAGAVAALRPCLSLVARPASSAALVLRRTGPFDSSPAPEGAPRFWVQAVSVGEVALARRFAAALIERFSNGAVVLTSSTPAGQRVLDNSFPDEERVATRPFPFDDRGSVDRALDAYRPRVLALLETELWPTLIEETAARGVPIAVINGRMSARSERWYGYMGAMMRDTLGLVSLFAVQTDETADRLRRLGVAQQRIVVTGNMKYDNVSLPVTGRARGQLLDALGLGSTAGPIIVAGSTRSGEEAAVLDAFCRLRVDFPDIKLVLAPRHLRRLAEIEKIIKQHGLPWRRRSAGAGGASSMPVVVLDTIGELQSVYSFADVAYVGGGMFPGVGGHNPLEPASLGKPVIFGPHMDNCREIADMLVEAGGAAVVADAAELEESVRRLLDDDTLRAETGTRAHEAIRTGQGATVRTLDLLSGLLGTTGTAS